MTWLATSYVRYEYVQAAIETRADRETGVHMAAKSLQCMCVIEYAETPQVANGEQNAALVSRNRG